MEILLVHLFVCHAHLVRTAKCAVKLFHT